MHLHKLMTSFLNIFRKFCNKIVSYQSKVELHGVQNKKFSFDFKFLAFRKNFKGVPDDP